MSPPPPVLQTKPWSFMKPVDNLFSCEVWRAYNKKLDEFLSFLSFYLLQIEGKEQKKGAIIFMHFHIFSWVIFYACCCIFHHALCTSEASGMTLGKDWREVAHLCRRPAGDWSGKLEVARRLWAWCFLTRVLDLLQNPRDFRCPAGFVARPLAAVQ